MADLPDVTDASFESEVVAADVPVLVDFWGEHCAPCRVIAPILAELASEYAGRVRIVRLDSDQNGEAMVKYHVMALPTVLAFAGGRVVGQISGARKKKDFADLIERALAAA